MGKTLTVNKPFFVLEEGDTMELSKDGKYYVSTYKENHEFVEEGNNMVSSYVSTYSIPVQVAEHLVEDGYLRDEQTDTFVNVFDEIDTLLDRYNKNLSEPDKSVPKVLQAEQETVLTNLITLLNHLKSLKK